MDDPTEHVDLALGADPTHSKLRAELRARLDELNTKIFKPNRGEDSVSACEMALSNGGFYGPFVEHADSKAWYTTEFMVESTEYLPWHGRYFLKLLHFMASSTDRVVTSARWMLPKVAHFITFKFDKCNPPPSATGITAGAPNLDMVLIPTMVVIGFWQEVWYAPACACMCLRSVPDILHSLAIAGRRNELSEPSTNL